MTKKQPPIGKITPKKVPADRAKPGRPDMDLADEASPIQQHMEKNSLAQAKERLDARAESFLITDSDLPVSRHYILFSIALFIVAFVTWASWAKLDEVTRGQGKIISSLETKTLQSLEGGIVDEFLVREGEQVKKGQILLRLRDIAASSDLGANEQRYLGTLAAVSRLQAEAEGLSSPDFPEDVMKKAPQSVIEEMNAFKATRKQIESQRSVLEQQLSQRQQEVREISTRINDTRGLLRIAKEEQSMIAPLVEKGSAPRMELLQLERSIKERQTELNGLTTSLPRAKSAVDEAEARLKELATNTKATAQTELAAKTMELNSLKETLAALEDRKTRTEMISPVDGFVQDIKVNTIGGVVQPGADVIEIVPSDDNLLIEARIRPDDIGFCILV
ncbi:MAG: HlyD family type I secretion periplasmic adaptor subunit [Rhodospirillales bacterium]|nr:HlyD family type I secretion periplasmic adaptor subunit [Rhodospirillales bacterium]